MPNWCDCDLAVEGKPEDVRKFQEAVAGEENGKKLLLDANKIIPYPEELKALDAATVEWDKKHQAWLGNLPLALRGNEEGMEKEFQAFVKENGDRPRDGYNRGGYEWCIEHWGTKRNFCYVEYGEEEEYDGRLTVNYNFDTAWSPPEPLIKKLGEMFPALTFDLRYFECGVGFNGMLRMAGGEVEADESGDYFGNRGG